MIRWHNILSSEYMLITRPCPAQNLCPINQRHLAAFNSIQKQIVSWYNCVVKPQHLCGCIERQSEVNIYLLCYALDARPIKEIIASMTCDLVDITHVWSSYSWRFNIRSQEDKCRWNKSSSKTTILSWRVLKITCLDMNVMCFGVCFCCRLFVNCTIQRD